MIVNKSYMNIVEDCGGGLQALDVVLGPLLHHNGQNNIFELFCGDQNNNRCLSRLSSSDNVFASTLLGAPNLTHSELIRRSFDFAVSIPVCDASLNISPMNRLTSVQKKEQLKILYDCITHLRPGYVNFYSLLLQRPVVPITPKIKSTLQHLYLPLKFAYC